MTNSFGMQSPLNTGPLRFLSLLLLLCVLAVPIQAGATDIQWRSWEPRVVDLGTMESATLTVVVDSDPATVELALATNGCVSTTELETIPLVPVAANTYEAMLTEAQLLHAYLDGDAHSIVGCLKLSGEPKTNVIVNVRTEDMPDVPTLQLAPDAQVGPHVLNLRDDDLLLGAHPPADRLIRFYLHLADEYDFIAVLDQVDTTTNRSYAGRRNSVQGTGTRIFDSLPPDFPPRLKGTIIFPIDFFFDAASKNLSHEWGHSVMAFLDNPEFTAGIPHWSISDLAFGIMGFSIPGSSAGGNFPFSLIEQADGNYLLQSVPAAREYNDLELYLMGLVGSEEVSDHIVFQNQNQRDQLFPSGILQGPVDIVTIEDVIAVNGPRIPAFGDAQTAFRMATVVLSEGRLLSPSEMAFFDHMAARGEAEVELPITEGLSRGITKPFFLATGGRATLSTTILDTSRPAIEIIKQISVDDGATFSDADNPGDADVPIATAPSRALYRLIVRNVGEVDLENVVINDPELGIADFFLGNLAIGQELVLTAGEIAQLNVTERCTAAGTFTNIADVSGQSAATGEAVTDSDPAVLVCEVVIPVTCNCESPNAITGSPRADFLFGTHGDDIICGFRGNDLIFGRSGNDCIDGGAGKDVLVGGSGDDALFGSKGRDLLFGMGGNDALNGGPDKDRCFGGPGTDTAINCEKVFRVP